MDLDRLLFSTPVRRLADKTQVFPLEKNDSVRTRLTHSHEVSNLSKSIGIRLVRSDPALFGDSDEIRNAVPIILATIGLAHDLGNPPFGHQGEVAISQWFSARKDWIFDKLSSQREVSDASFVPVEETHRSDFTKFEGNAQTLRLVSRLQNTAHSYGLDLTVATLSALMKYTVSSNGIQKTSAPRKKHGYFASELVTVEWIRKETGISEGQRHPLTWIMEAGDDIAYSVLDIEDAIKKMLISAEDLLAYLRVKHGKGELVESLIDRITSDFKKADCGKYTQSRVREIKASYLRTRLIERLITGATSTFLQDKEQIFGLMQERPLLDCDSVESHLCSSLKEFASIHAYQSPSVLEVELKGSKIITGLMDDMWEAISDREAFAKPSSRRRSPKSSYVYSLISDSYRWHFEEEKTELPVRYREMQLLSDMISGMTDGYALSLYEKIQSHTTY